MCLFVLKGFPNQIHVYLSIETYKNHKCIYIYSGNGERRRTATSL